MKKQTMLSFFAIFSFTWLACAAARTELDRVTGLSRLLSEEGVPGFLSTVQANKEATPWIPDAWHVENRIDDPERIQIAKAGRAFGIELAASLESVAVDLQKLPPDEALFAEASNLCTLAEWIAGADGIGNLLLTVRCQDLAAVGLGRLVANLDFPLERCEALAKRLRDCGRLADVPHRIRVLNAEIGADVFGNCKSNGDMSRVWEAGVRRNLREDILRMRASGSSISDYALSGDSLVSDELLEDNKGFFTNTPMQDPSTVLNRMKKGCNHSKVIVGLSFRTRTKALGLLDFRREIGWFPEPWVRSEEEWKRLKEEIAEAAKWGIKMTPAEESPSFDPLREAFQRTWREKVPDIKRGNDYIDAFYAYKEISENRFFDEDTAKIHLEQEGRRLMQEWEEKRAAELQKGVEGGRAVP
jgi:hypothetical protein